MKDTKLMEEVNPVFSTAQACLLVMAEAGDADAKKIVSTIGFDRGITTIDKDAITEMEKFQRMKSIPGFTTMIEARFTASSNLILRSHAETVIDLPCGYTPRGLQLARSGVFYYGFDLPAVISVIHPACSEMYSGDVSPAYHAVDATNYDSLRSALKNVKGELFITTEGLLMYLTQSELEEVFCNIARLLDEFGGLWVTTDNMMVSTQKKIQQAICPGEEMSEASVKAPRPENVFFDPQQSETFVKDMGFSLKKISVYDYLPEHLNTLEHYPEGIRHKAREAFRHMHFWMMELDTDAVKKQNDPQHMFRMESRRAGRVHMIALQGRLDTLTAPQLLDSYRQENEKNPIDSIDIDTKDLDYISSAGLRVLLIMMKDRPEKGCVTIYNLKPEVKSIITASGFENMLCVR